ncbi:uncharacterized mitochondrial protein AtMg00810-like [Vigna angularis]|uniref:uncharacterized mitochondrial protein AtMg00810-like n=1 Tax=Phaseolus angularis TaxID=3914 RepID=UPI0008099DF5|nr:uncharacterized mitochondrial protein AtMg00810-like [Vigna angularis]
MNYEINALEQNHIWEIVDLPPNKRPVDCNDSNEIESIKAHLDHEFSIKNLGKLRYFLGLEISRSFTGIVVNQRKYALELLKENDMLAAKPISTPMEPSTKFISSSGNPLSDPQPYRRLVGQLMYLTTTRPDLAFVTQQLSQYVSQPMDTHHSAAMRVLRYIKGSPAKGLHFPANSSLMPSNFADSDWGSCIETRKSVTGYCVFLGSSLICWKTKKQTIVSRSSSEAEYRALAALSCELQWLHFLLTDLQVPPTAPISVFCDNQSAIYLAHNPTFHERTKHIEIDCHVICKKIQSGLLHLLPISSYAQLADMFTKALHPKVFTQCISKLGLFDVHSPP